MESYLCIVWPRDETFVLVMLHGCTVSLPPSLPPTRQHRQCCLVVPLLELCMRIVIRSVTDVLMRALGQLQHNFWAAFVEQGLWADRIYCILCTFIWTVPAIRLFLTGAATVKYALVITGANALVAAVQCLAPTLYMRHRTAICVCLKICSSFCASAIRSAPTSK